MRIAVRQAPIILYYCKQKIKQVKRTIEDVEENVSEEEDKVDFGGEDFAHSLPDTHDSGESR